VKRITNLQYIYILKPSNVCYVVKILFEKKGYIMEQQDKLILQHPRQQDRTKNLILLSDCLIKLPTFIWGGGGGTISYALNKLQKKLYYITKVHDYLYILSVTQVITFILFMKNNVHSSAFKCILHCTYHTVHVHLNHQHSLPPHCIHKTLKYILHYCKCTPNMAQQHL
jgi:hypothetical protein